VNQKGVDSTSAEKRIIVLYQKPNDYNFHRSRALIKTGLVQLSRRQRRLLARPDNLTTLTTCLTTTQLSNINAPVTTQSTDLLMNAKNYWMSSRNQWWVTRMINAVMRVEVNNSLSQVGCHGISNCLLWRNSAGKIMASVMSREN
jgi:hypothetical protein